MNITEIYPLISEKAKNIIEANQPFKSGKSLVFNYDEYSHMQTNKEKYEIFVNRCKTNDKFEIAILHEFLHCLQHEENFPSLFNLDGTKDRFVTELSSSVLDLDIGDRLSKYGYDRFIGYKEYINANLSILYCAKLTGDTTYLFKIDENFSLSSFLAYLNYFNFFTELNSLMPLVKEFKPKIVNDYNIFLKGLKMYSYNNPKGVYKIFKYLLKGLKLENRIKII